MVSRALSLAVLGLVCAVAAVQAVPAVPITIVWDNRATEIVKQERETRKNMANILCGRINQSDIVLPAQGSSGLVDQSNPLDSKTTAQYYCKAADGKQETAVRIFAACNAKANKDNFTDEMADDTDFPELEVETITCNPTFADIP